MSGRGKYKMGTIARLTGLNAALLRAWERRYDLLEPERTEGGHRLYTEEDLQVLLQVKERIDEGASIGEVARQGRRDLLTHGLVATAPGRPGPDEADPEATAPESRTELERCLDAVVAAAVALDRPALDRALDRAFSLVSPEHAVALVLEPAAHRIGELWVAGKCSVAGEHLASSTFIRRMHKLLEATNSTLGSSAPLVVTACFPDEQHEVGALVVAYYLNLHGIRVTHLGASLPFEELERALEVMRPFGVYLSVTRASLFLAHKPRLLEMIRRRSGDLEFIVGGQGLENGDPDLEKAGVRIWSDGRPVRELGSELIPARL